MTKITNIVYHIIILFCLINYSIQAVQYCSTYSDEQQTVCTQCITAYFVSNDGSQCFPQISGCKTHNKETGGCTTCDSQHYLDSSNSCVEKNIDNCSTYNTNGKCTACDTGYFLGEGVTEGDQCFQETENCETYSADNTEWICTECVSGYVLQDNLCYLIISNCETQAQNQCTACVTGYHQSADNQLCYIDIANCSTYNDDLCATCEANFHASVDNKSCIDDIDNCTDGSYTDDKCTGCDTGFVLSEDQLTCYTEIENCATQVDDQCTACEQNFNLSSDNLQCYAAIQNCLDQDTETTCAECDIDYHLSTDKSTCIQDVEFCSAYSGTDESICQTCITNYIYYATENICYVKFFNCADQVEGQYVCNSCKTGYHLSNDEDQCVDDVDQCVDYSPDDSTLCILCEDDYYLDENSLCQEGIQNCGEYDTSGCLSCSTGFHFNTIKDSCIEDIQNCTTYDSTDETLCATCGNGYTLNDAKTLCYTIIENCTSQSQEICNSCNTGYHLSVNTYSCFADLDKCLTYDTSSGNLDCATCDTGYHLGINSEVTADSNTSGTACFVDIQNCITYSEQDGSKCTDCDGDQLYYLYNNSICLDYVDNCQTYDSVNNVCSTCLNGYHLFNETCSQDIENCTAYSDSDGSCTECEGYYVLSDSVCIYGCSVENCSTCNDDFYCEQCSSGYTLSDSKRSCDTTCPSYPSILNCDQCTEFVCSDCSAGFFINASSLCSSCSKISQNCQDCSSTACTQCDENFILTNGKCRSCEFAFDGTNTNIGCSECTYASDNFTCSKCESGYYLSSNKCTLCSEKISNCNVCSSGSLCTSCQDGFYLNASNVCASCNSGMETCYLSSGSIIASTCKAGYYFDTDLCTKCNQNCLTCKINATTCTSCADGFYFQENSCITLTDGDEPESMTTLQQVYDYSVIQSYFRGNQKYYQFFDEASSSNVCSSDSECNNGDCKIKYCQCNSEYFGIKCQYSSSDSQSIQSSSQLIYQTLQSLYTNQASYSTAELNYLTKLLMIMSSFSNVLAAQLYEKVAILNRNFFDKLEQDFSQVQINRYMQTAIQLQNGLYNNYIMTDSNQANLKITAYAKQLKDSVMQRYFINLQNSDDQSITIDEYSVGGKYYKIDPTSDESPSFVLEEATTRRFLQQQVRVLQTDDMSTVQACTFEELDDGITYISQSDYDSIVDYLYDNSQASDSTITITMVTETNLDIYNQHNITVQTGVYTMEILDSDGNLVNIDDIGITLIHHIPKSDQADTEDRLDYYCYQWNEVDELFNTDDILTDVTKNCEYYIICGSDNSGTYVASKDQLEIDDGNSNDSTSITATKIVSQPGFIINASLLFLLLVLLAIFSFLVENHPEKQKTRKKVHLPQISSDYKRKRDQDQRNFENAERNGVQYQNRSIVQNQMQKSQMDRSQMSRSKGFNNLTYTNNNFDARSNFQINPPRSNRFDMDNDFQPQITESRFITDSNQNNNNFQKNKIQMLPSRANAYLDSQPSDHRSDRYLHQRGSMVHSEGDTTPKNPPKVVIERNINPWMLYHFYSIYHTHQIGLRLMKISLMIGTLQFYAFMLCIFFGYTEANLGYAMAWVILTLIATWVYNYLLGSISICFRNKSYGSNTMHPIYWGIYFLIIFLGFSIGSVIAAYNESQETHNYIVYSFFICIGIDFLFLDIFISFILQSISDESSQGFIKLMKILRLKGYYNIDD